MCVFCRIANGEIPAYKIYEDKDFIAFLDISQATIGHTLIVTKEHFDNIFTLNANLAEHMGKLIVQLANHLNSVLKTENINLVNNSGALAGQTINHFHLHLIPRYKNDGITIKFNKNKLSPADFKDLCTKLNLIE
ncbi:MAG: HIT domain-containing protein [Bacilli bacterium]|nr:HIT domain-containing protein [Bacilli bacterium]MDD4387713.1 HIT domain-containing protein [Bacilli bacterium]